MRNHHQVSCIQDFVFTACQANEGATMGEQMKNNHVLCGGSKLFGERASGRGVYTPRRRELSVVEERSLEFHDL
jgi:hypothetical protein